jgi:glycosyltransferase involved in cell wall biosynthesis
VNHNFAPVSGRSVIFLHDVMFQTDPEWFTRSERMYFGLMPLLAPRASLVTTSTTSELERVRANNPRIKAVERVGIGLDPDLRALPAHMPSAAAGLTGFVLSVGRLNIRKNLAFTLRAAVASGALTPDRPLVVVGEREGKADDLQPVVAEAIADGLVRFIGQVSVSELRWLYENADLFLFLSLGEGFGLPPLEALSCGCPVLVSDLPVFRETMADRARFTSPTNLAVAAHAIAHALAIEGRAADAKLLPLDPERFEWSACVARLRSAIEHHVLRAS